MESSASTIPPFCGTSESGAKVAEPPPGVGDVARGFGPAAVYQTKPPTPAAAATPVPMMTDRRDVPLTDDSSAAVDAGRPVLDDPAGCPGWLDQAGGAAANGGWLPCHGGGGPGGWL